MSTEPHKNLNRDLYQNEIMGREPWYYGLTADDLAKIRALLGSARETMPGAARQVCERRGLTPSNKAVANANRDGRLALEKQEKGEELNPREIKAAAFHCAVLRAKDRAFSLLFQQALGDEPVIYTTADVRDANGAIVKKGTQLKGSRSCAMQAMEILRLTCPHLQAGYMESIEDPLPAEDAVFDEEQTKALARAYLAQTGHAFTDGYDATTAAPANGD